MKPVKLTDVQVVIDESSKHIVVYGKNSKIDERPWCHDIVSPATIEFFDTNTVSVTGDLREYDFNSMHSDPVNEEDVDDSEFTIKKTFFLRREKRVMNKGWVLMKKREPFHQVFLNYTVRME